MTDLPLHGAREGVQPTPDTSSLVIQSAYELGHLRTIRYARNPEGLAVAENALVSRVDRLEAALARLADAQAARQGEIRALAEAQRRTEERLDALIVRVDQLAEAQIRTEQALVRLTVRVDDLTQRIERVEEQLSRLTARVDDLTVRLEQLTARVDQFAARVDDLTQQIERVEEQIAQLTQRMERVEDQIARLTDRTSSLTGIVLELRYRERAHVYFNRVLRRVRLLSPDALDRLLDEAEAAGRLTPAESEDLRLADVLARHAPGGRC